MENTENADMRRMNGAKIQAEEATVRYNALIDLIIEFRLQGLGYTSISKKLAENGIVNEHTEKPWSQAFVKKCIERAIKEGKLTEPQTSLTPVN